MGALVAIDLPWDQGFVAALRRVWDQGDAVLPIDQRLPAPAVQRLLLALRPSAILDRDGRRSWRRGEPVEDGDALVMPTSGTTGEPKGAVLTHAAIRASALATTRRLGVDPGRHRWLACLPLSHVGGLSVVTRALLTGTPLEVHPRFDEAAVSAAGGPEVFVSLVPTALRRVDPSIFHTVVLGGSTPPAARPANVVTTYGMTETGSGVVYDGVPLDGVEVRVDGATRAGAGTDRPGQIRLRAPMLLRAYRDGSVPLDARGWYATGDAGTLGPDGNLRVDGRLSELIITGGENVWPAAVESVLLQHPSVAEAAVAGRPDTRWGERVVAWVVPTDPAAPPALAELKELVARRLAPWAAPRELVLVADLARTSLGKVRRDRLA